MVKVTATIYLGGEYTPDDPRHHAQLARSFLKGKGVPLEPPVPMSDNKQPYPAVWVEVHE